MPGYSILGNGEAALLHEDLHHVDGVFTEVHAWWPERGWWSLASLAVFCLNGGIPDQGDVTGEMPMAMETALSAAGYPLIGWREALARLPPRD